MIYGVIDIGSNSVRLLLSDGTEKIYKKAKITALARGMGGARLILSEAAERTFEAVVEFVNEARNVGADEIFVFATAAVRNAANSREFTERLKVLTNIDVDVVSGGTEGYLGALGATGGNGGVIDSGGASTEIAVMKDGASIYSLSVDVGCVNLTDVCEQNRFLADRVVSEKVALYGQVPCDKFYAIGGTATSLAAIDLELDVYDPTKIHGYFLSQNRLNELKEKLYSFSVGERERLKGLQPQRARVIASGSSILGGIVDYLGVDGVTVSENDNLEGYLKYVLEKK